MELFDFAYCPSWDRKLSLLASIALPEVWGDANGGQPLAILKSYIFHTFNKIYLEYSAAEEDRKSNILYISPDRSVCVFNTGLFDKSYEPIFATFLPNDPGQRQYWKLQSFLTTYQAAVLGYTLPRRADYFSDPSLLIFNTHYTVFPPYDHILSEPENFSRFPSQVRSMARLQIKGLFDGALKNTIKRIESNYKTAVPQYYRGQIQLLIPICLTNNELPDLALALSREENTERYIGRTCLTMKMAYNNARLIVRPDSDWLKP